MRKDALISVLAAFVTLLFAGSSRAQSGTSQPSAAQAAKSMYTDYCASCHGLSGKGDGPVARGLKTRPPDLTTLAQRNRGQFPEMRVLGAIKAGPGVPTHGSATMPVWGPIFTEVTGAATEAEVQLKIYNLMEYIKTLQGKTN